VAAITRGAGIRWAAPFAEAPVVEALVARAIAARPPRGEDPKSELRALAVSWGFPAEIAHRPKSASSAPPLPRAFFPAADRVARLASAMKTPLAWSDDDRRNVGIASLDALVDALRIGV